ncbi:hypothetical protein G9A89_004648 [Geosiphon pyriformis]|nr:hypothetical protein G9A89_004648 [Geosiphon pyriformis]
MAKIVTSVFDSGLAGLRTYLSTKKNCMNSVYFCETSYKKPKKSVVINIVDLSTDLLSLVNIGNANGKPVMSWRSKVDSIKNSVSGFSNLENMKNMVAKKTSYIDSDNSVGNKDMNETTLRKTWTQIYILNHLPKALLFSNISDNSDILGLFLSKFVGSNQLPSVKSHVLERRSFESVKLFVLDIELAAVPTLVEFDSLDVASLVASK